MNTDTKKEQETTEKPVAQMPYIVYPYPPDMEDEYEDDGLSITEYAIRLWTAIRQQRRRLAWHIGIAALIGCVIATGTPKKYTSVAVLAPEIQGSANGLSKAASSLGIGSSALSRQTEAIYPEIYPEVLASPDFLTALLDVNVCLRKDPAERTYAEHLKKDLSTSWISYPMMLISKAITSFSSSDEGPNISKATDKNSNYKMPNKKEAMIKVLAASMGCETDKKTSIITISFTDQDPLVAAIMVDTIQMRLQEYVTAYRTRKAQNDYDYYKRILADADERYEKAQKEYVRFTESNIEMMRPGFLVKRSELESRATREFSIANQIRLQLTQAEARIQESKPAFTIIKSPKMPNKPSGRSRKTTVLAFAFLGFVIFSLRALFIDDFISKMKQQN